MRATISFCLLAILWALPLGAQNPNIPPDQLMGLMLSQPKIDVSFPIAVTATFDPPVIAPGSRATYRVTVGALEASIEWPAKLKNPGGLELRTGGRGQILVPGAGNLIPHTSFLYRTTPKSAGRFTIPAYDVQVYGQSVTIPAATLDVSTGAVTQPANPDVRIEISPTNLFVGQPVRAKIIFPGPIGGFAQGLSTVQFNGEGFVTDPNTVQQRIEMLPPEKPFQPARSAFIYEILLTPIASGRISVSAQGYSIGNRYTGPIVISGGGATPQVVGIQYTLLDSDPLDLDIRPLPASGQLRGFKGAVGTFTLDPPRISTNSVKVGDSLKLTVSVRGPVGAGRLVAPSPPRDKQWQIFSAPPDNLPIQFQHAQGFATFNYLLVPLTPEVKATPSIPFSYFDPATGRFVDLSIPPVPVTVTGDAAPAAMMTLREKAFLAEPVEVTLQLNDLAATRGIEATTLVPLQQQPWFPFAQAAPAIGFAALWFWDRRRRHLEAHPEILERRHARRALKQHWREARSVATNGDAATYARSVISALRAGCAPFFPATPRALVGSDMLKVLPETGANPARIELLRRLFNLADAAQYSEDAPELRELLARQTDYDAVLGELEEKLRA